MNARLDRSCLILPAFMDSHNIPCPVHDEGCTAVCCTTALTDKGVYSVVAWWCDCHPQKFEFAEVLGSFLSFTTSNPRTAFLSPIFPIARFLTFIIGGYAWFLRPAAWPMPGRTSAFTGDVSTN